MNNTQLAVLKWLANGDTGESSETMAFYLGFSIVKKGKYHPYDTSDFDRCLQLLNDAPALRNCLHKMASLSKSWAALVENWAAIEKLHLDEVGLGWTKSFSGLETHRLIRKTLKDLHDGN